MANFVISQFRGCNNNYTCRVLHNLSVSIYMRSFSHHNNLGKGAMYPCMLTPAGSDVSVYCLVDERVTWSSLELRPTSVLKSVVLISLLHSIFQQLNIFSRNTGNAYRCPEK